MGRAEGSVGHLHHRGRHVTQALDVRKNGTENRNSLSTLLTATIISAARQLMLHAAITHDKRQVRHSKTHRLGHHRTTIEEEGMVALAEEADEWVHDADRCTDELLLRPLTEPDELVLEERQFARTHEREGRCYLQGGRRTEPGAKRYGAVEGCIEPIQDITGSLQRCRHPCQVVVPLSSRAQEVKIELSLFIEGE